MAKKLLDILSIHGEKHPQNEPRGDRMKRKRKGKGTLRHRGRDAFLDDLKSTEDLLRDLPELDLNNLPDLDLSEAQAWIESIDWVLLGRLLDETLGYHHPETRSDDHRDTITPTSDGKHGGG